ncbi:hypothetical protein [Spirosoma flavum]|uniref:Uncharacterized protein n=1 Tax=Spirosoma flavum TaxID=2048557 RepID=A0ABW6AHA9_9BACT
MKRTASINFLAIILTIGLLASLGVNIYQLYSHGVRGSSDSEAVDQATEAAQLLKQLSTCDQENTRKDSVIAVLRNSSASPAYSTLSTRQGP